MKNKIKVGVIGSAGYTGGELIRLLINHNYVEIIFLHSNSNKNKFVYEVHKDLLGATDLCFTDILNPNIDVLFMCLGHNEANKFLQENKINDKIKIIDLSQDFRIKNNYENKKFIYGLPELNKNLIKNANNIANPGCFATAIQLSIIPILSKQILQEINIVGITGSTGAGQSLQNTSHFSWRANNISAYKTLTHQHLNEIKNNFKLFLNNENININFIPWRGDFARGIFVSTIYKSNFNIDEIEKIYNDFYKDSPFTHILKNTLDLKQVINTNNCFIQIEKENDTVVVHAAIDNLIKGASGQALQNMNLMFNLEEKEGLRLKNIAF